MREEYLKVRLNSINSLLRLYKLEDMMGCPEYLEEEKRQILQDIVLERSLVKISKTKKPLATVK